MNSHFRFCGTGLALLLASVTSLRADSAERAELEALRAKVRQLEAQLDALARQIEAKEAVTSAPAAAIPTVTVNDRGFTAASADRANSIRFRGLVQLDHRLFFDDAGLDNNAFVLRRARVITEGQFAQRYGFQFVTEFGGSTVSILDANLTIALTPSAQLKIGKFKVPVGHEQLQSDSWTFFNERSIVTNLVPGRDLGIQLSGDGFENRMNYALGLFNGVADGATSNNADFDEEKDVAGRIFITPRKNDADSRWRGLGLGLSGSFGRQKTASGRTSGYRSDGQQTFFSYQSGVVADGKTWRVSPHLDYRLGSLGLQAEYVLSVANLRAVAGGPITEVDNRAWQVAAGYVLTGEESSYHGVVPRTNFDRAAGTWGAFEIVGRFARLDVDDAVFPALALPGSAATEVSSLGLGLNWYLSKATMLKLAYYQANFDMAAGAPVTPATPVLRQDEKAMITRFQVSF